MRKTRFWPAAAISLCGLAAALLLSACGGAAREETAANEVALPAYDDAAMDTMPAPEAAAQAEAGGGGPTLTLPQDDRKIIITANLSIETLDFTETCEDIQRLAAGMGGHVASTDINTGSTDSRYANFTVRVPAERYTDFIAEVEQTGNLTSRTEQSEDVTDQYVDLEARLKALRTEEAWLLEQMAEADDISYLIELRDRLSEVQYNIEYYEGSRRQLDNLTAYSTVHIHVSQVQQYTEPPKESYGEQIAGTFGDAWYVTLQVLQNIGLFLVAIHPFLIFCAVVLAVVLITVKLTKKHRQAHPKPPKPAAGPHDEAPPAQPMPPYGMPYMPYPPYPAPRIDPPAPQADAPAKDTAEDDPAGDADRGMD